MNTRPFGKTGSRASEMGLGWWQLGGSDWGAIDDRAALDILAAAVDAGVNFLDTADVYGGGRSEELIGRFLTGRSERIYVATKLGRAGDSGSGSPRQDGRRPAPQAEAVHADQAPHMRSTPVRSRGFVKTAFGPSARTP